MSNRLIAMMLFLISVSVVAGQDNIRFKTLGLEQGLSQQNVRAIHQDSHGFMWFGTQEGLNRFDGYKFLVYSNSLYDETSIGSSFIYDIAETADGDIWLATDVGISRFDRDTQTFQRYKYLQDINQEPISDARTIFVTSDNTVWVGTANGLNVYQKDSNSFVNVPMVGMQGDEPRIVTSIVEDISGGIWISVAFHGLFRLNPMTQKVELFASTLDKSLSNSQPRINHLMVDNHQTLWVSSLNQGLFTLDLTQTHIGDNPFKRIPELEGYMTLSLFQDRQENMWIGTDKGLFVLGDENQNLIRLVHDSNNPESIADNRISSIFQDSGGVVWVGTYRGLSKWNTATAKFDYYKSDSDNEQSLSNPNINAIVSKDASSMWVGTYFGLNKLDIKRGTVEQFLAQENTTDSIKENNITALQIHDKDIWIGYRNSGLSRLNQVTNIFTHYTGAWKDQTKLGSNGVTSMVSSQTGELWVATFNGGLNKYLPESDSFMRVTADTNDPNTLSSNKIVSIYEDSNQVLWAGTWDAGLNMFDPNTNNNVRIMANNSDQKSLGSNQVWVVHEDTKGNIWIGTQGSGLNFLSAENLKDKRFEFEIFGRESGLPSSVVYGILEDEDGYLWLSTNRGLTKFDPESKTVLNYDSSHGLQGNEFNAGAFHKTANGQLFFGGTNGITAFYPRNISPNNHVLPVVITRFQRLNEITEMGSNLNKTNNIEISHKDYLVAFEFAGLDFASPSNNQYAYKLEGFDSEWIEARDIRKATYTNLPAGTYRFRVKASNNDGIWNEEGTDVLLTVLPAPWFSWWAYTFYTIILIGIFYLTYRSYLNKLEEKEVYQKKLEAEVQKRTAELSDVNEQLLNASVTDQLTGMHNRRYLTNRIDSDCSKIIKSFLKHQAQNNTENDFESGPRLSILMFDLDGFKPINDTYGHDAGDKVIVKVCELLKRVCRDDDVIVRWGGDEFLVISSIKHLNESNILAERIRNVITTHEFNIAEAVKVKLSCSIGFACYPFMHDKPEALSWEQTQQLADKALYKAKEAGRNRWVGVLENEQTSYTDDSKVLTDDVDMALNLGLLRLKTATT